jgi:hypothetical protein
MTGSPKFLIFRNFLDASVETVILIPPSRLIEGRFAIVTDVRRDAVDADAPLTNGAKADGEVVWS